MVLEKIYVARHGYRANWLPPPHAPNPTGIDSDPPLAPHGVDQAHELAAFISSSVDPRPELCFSSPFYRCVETATPLANTLNIPIFLERGLGEWYKKDRDVVPEPASVEVLHSFFNRVSGEWDPKTVVPSPQGEDESDIFHRCQEFIPKFISKFEAKYPDVKSVMFVTHAATKIALGMALLKYNGVRELLREEHGGDGKSVVLKAGTCSVDSYVRQGDSWNIELNGETSFLNEGEEMNWHFNNKYEAGSDEDIAERARLASLAKGEAIEGEEDEEMESVYVTLALPRVGKVDKSFESNVSRDKSSFESMLATSVTPSSTLQISGLETRQPLMKINSSAYQGEWTNLNGSELIFDESGEFVAKSDYRLNLTAGTLVHKDQEEDEDSLPSSNRYSILQQALSRAQKK